MADRWDADVIVHYLVCLHAIGLLPLRRYCFEEFSHLLRLAVGAERTAHRINYKLSNGNAPSEPAQLLMRE